MLHRQPVWNPSKIWRMVLLVPRSALAILEGHTKRVPCPCHFWSPDHLHFLRATKVPCWLRSNRAVSVLLWVIDATQQFSMFAQLYLCWLPSSRVTATCNEWSRVSSEEVALGLQAPVLPSNHWQFNVWVNQKVVGALIRLLWRMNPILCCTTLQSLKCCACTIVLDGFGCVLKRFERYIIGIIWESMGTWIWLNTIPYRSCLEPYTKRPKKVCVAMARASARNDGKWSVQSKETGLASLKRHFHHM